MRTWLTAALVLALPAALAAQEDRRIRSSGSPRPATRSVSVRHVAPAPARTAPVVNRAQGAPTTPPVQPAATGSETAVPTTPAVGTEVRSRLKGHGWSGRFARPIAKPRSLQNTNKRADAPAPEETPLPPYANKPGALIRTEGLGYTHKPAEPERLHVIEAGDKIVQEPSKTQPFGGIGAHSMPPDKLPPPTPGSAASGRNAITPNATDSGNNR